MERGILWQWSEALCGSGNSRIGCLGRLPCAHLAQPPGEKAAPAPLGSRLPALCLRPESLSPPHGGPSVERSPCFVCARCRLWRQSEGASGRGRQSSCNRDVAVAGQPAAPGAAHLWRQHHRPAVGPDGGTLLPVSPGAGRSASPAPPPVESLSSDAGCPTLAAGGIWPTGVPQKVPPHAASPACLLRSTALLLGSLHVHSSRGCGTEPLRSPPRPGRAGRPASQPHLAVAQSSSPPLALREPLALQGASQPRAPPPARRGHLLTKQWHVKGGSESLGSAASVPVEKVFVVDIKYMFPKDEDIALVKLQRPLSAPGERGPRTHPWGRGVGLSPGCGRQRPLSKALPPTPGVQTTCCWGRNRSPPPNPARLSCTPTSAPTAESVRPICLPFFDEELGPGTPLWVTGWGYTEENGESFRATERGWGGEERVNSPPRLRRPPGLLPAV